MGMFISGQSIVSFKGSLIYKKVTLFVLILKLQSESAIQKEWTIFKIHIVEFRGTWKAPAELFSFSAPLATYVGLEEESLK